MSIARDINEQVNRLNKTLSYIGVYGLNTVFFDTDLKSKNLLGANMVIIAPHWDVVGAPKIILDGSQGTNHTESHGKNAEGYGNYGADGLPGNPGGKAGHFLGAGHHFFSPESLIISLNGGKGGYGQKGGDGAEGKKGKDGDLNFSIRGDKLDVSKCSQVIGHNPPVCYKHGDKGTAGGDAGEGGLGGKGGFPGSNFNLLGTQSNWQVLNNHGLKGRDGDAGTPGEGGMDGKAAKRPFTEQALREKLNFNILIASGDMSWLPEVITSYGFVVASNIIQGKGVASLRSPEAIIAIAGNLPPIKEFFDSLQEKITPDFVSETPYLATFYYYAFNIRTWVQMGTVFIINGVWPASKVNLHGASPMVSYRPKGRVQASLATNLFVERYIHGASPRGFMRV